jgi:hypothetical protein
MSNSLRNSFAVTKSLTMGWASTTSTLAFNIVTLGGVVKTGLTG